MRSPDRRPAVIALGVALVLVAAVVLVLALPAGVLAAGPSPTPAAGVGDPRSSGQGPGLVGDPLTAILVVGGIAIFSLLATLAYVRATGGARTGDRR